MSPCERDRRRVGRVVIEQAGALVKHRQRSLVRSALWAVVGRLSIAAYALLGIAALALLLSVTDRSVPPGHLATTAPDPQELAAQDAPARQVPLPMEEWVRTGSCWNEEVAGADDTDPRDTAFAASPADAVSELVADARELLARHEAAARAATSNRRALRLRASVSRERAAVLPRLEEDEALAVDPDVTSVWTVDDAGEVVAYAELHHQPGDGWHVASSAVRLSPSLCGVLRGADADD